MELSLSLSRATCVAPSPHVCAVAAMFGLGIDEARQLTIVPATRLAMHPNTLIFITGPSGGGKSSLLRLIAEAAAARGDARMIRFDDLPPMPALPLVDALASCVQPALDLPRVLELLSLTGLSDAFVMLRTPGELSDGQRHRLRLAQAMALVDQPGDELRIILADEFAATLDRISARVIARHIRKWVSRCGKPVCFIAATTHDDLLEYLEPDVLIEKGLGSQLVMAVRSKGGADSDSHEGV